MNKKYKIGYVYKITNPKGQNYVGATIDINRRKSEYKRLYCVLQHRIYNSLLKYGFDNHEFIVLWEGDVSLLYKKETEYGILYNVMDEKLGLNGGLMGCPLRKDSKRKLSENNARVKPTKETKLKSKKAVQRPIIQYSKTGRVIKKFDSATDASAELKIGRSNIKNALNGFSLSAGGFIWKFRDGIKGKMDRPVIQFDRFGKKVKEHKNIGVAARSIAVDRKSITYALQGSNRTTGGYHWKYAII